MEDLCQRIPRVSAKIFGLVENQTLIKCKESSRVIYNLMENERFFWIRIILGNEGSLQDSWKKVVDKTPFSIIKEFAVVIQQFLNMVCYENDGQIWKNRGQRIWSPLYIAAGVGNSELYQYIATKTSDGNHGKDDKKWTDLHTAVYYGNFKTFRLIFENVANKNPRNAWGDTPLHIAVYKGCFEICNLIIANVDNKNPKYHKDHQLGAMHGETTFYKAAEYGHIEICKLFIDNLANKNPCDDFRISPLHVAAGFGHLEVCKLLMENLLEKNPANDFGFTPLHSAARSGHLEVCRLLMENILDKNPRSGNDLTPLHLAALGGHLELYKLILVNTKVKTPEDVDGCTPLHFAAITPFENAKRWLSKIHSKFCF